MVKLREPDQLPIEAQECKDLIRIGSARRPEKQCTKCGCMDFHAHEKCLRWFSMVVRTIVCPILCVIYRWRCANCGATFRNLPSICVRFKRYLRPEMEKRSEAYVESDPISYRKVVREDGFAVVYDGPIADVDATEAEKEREWVPELAHTTPYRWISSIARCRERLQPVVNQARRVSDLAPRLSTIMISSAKYRSEARKRALQACCLLLRAMRIVGLKNPTEFATLGSSP